MNCCIDIDFFLNSRAKGMVKGLTGNTNRIKDCTFLNATPYLKCAFRLTYYSIDLLIHMFSLSPHLWHQTCYRFAITGRMVKGPTGNSNRIKDCTCLNTTPYLKCSFRLTYYSIDLLIHIWSLSPHLWHQTCYRFAITDRMSEYCNMVIYVVLIFHDMID